MTEPFSGFDLPTCDQVLAFELLERKLDRHGFVDLLAKDPFITKHQDLGERQT